MKKTPYLDILKSLLPVNEWKAFLESYSKPLPKSITIMKHKISTEEFLKETNRQWWKLSTVPHEKGDTRREGVCFSSPSRPGQHFLHQGWFFYIQEKAASLPAQVLLDSKFCLPLRKATVQQSWREVRRTEGFFETKEKEAPSAEDYKLKTNELILDMCAAPGGKSIQLADTWLPPVIANEAWQSSGNNFIVSNEPIDPRRKALIFNINRTWCYNTMVTSYDGTRIWTLFPETFDKVLIDAPCSGEGMNYKLDRKRKLRSKNSFDGRAMPTIWETASSTPTLRGKELQISKTVVHKIAIQQSRDELKIKKIAALQYQLLKSWILACKPWWTIIYSTCTLNPIENEWVIANIMQEFSWKIELENVDVEWKSTGMNMWRWERIMESDQASKLARFRPHRNHIGWFFIAKIKKLETLSSFAKEEVRRTGGFKIPLAGGFRGSSELQSEVRHHLQEEFGIEKNNDYFFISTGKSPLYWKGEAKQGDLGNIYITSSEYKNFPDHLKNNAGKIWIPIYTIGKHATPGFNQGRIPTHHLGNILGHLATKNVIELSDQQAQDYSDHKDLSVPVIEDPALAVVATEEKQSGNPFVILTWQKKWFSLGKIVDWRIKNKMI